MQPKSADAVETAPEVIENASALDAVNPAPPDPATLAIQSQLPAVQTATATMAAPVPPLSKTNLPYYPPAAGPFSLPLLLHTQTDCRQMLVVRVGEMVDFVMQNLPKKALCPLGDGSCIARIVDCSHDSDGNPWPVSCFSCSTPSKLPKFVCAGSHC